MKKRKWNDEQFIKAVKSSLSYAEVIRKLGLKVAGSNYDTVKRKIKELDLDTSHMTGQVWNVGENFRIIKPARPLNEILVENSSFTNTNHLKQRLLNEGIKEPQCECCGLRMWMGKPISLELHHKNGVKNDLRIENLQILCPNCHALTDNYRGKNLSAYKEICKVELRKFRETLTGDADGNPEPSLYEEGAETIHGESKLHLAA